MDKNAISLGLQIGRFIAGQRRKPVAYLYNGVKLPPLPEWDRDTYPYVYICTSNDVYYLTARSEPQGCSKTGQLFLYSGFPEFTCKDGTWSEGISGLLVSALIVWANHDVYYDSASEELSGTLLMEASEPVPVYE